MKVYNKDDVDITFSDWFMDLEQLTSFDAISLAKVKQAREKIENIGMCSYLEVIGEIECNDREVRLSKKFATAILDKLIAESEE